MKNFQQLYDLRLAVVISSALMLTACAPAPIAPPDMSYTPPPAYPEQYAQMPQPQDYDPGGDYGSIAPAEDGYEEAYVPDEYEPEPTPVPRPVVRPTPAPIAKPKPKQKPVVNTIIAESTTTPLQDAGSVQVETLDVTRPRPNNAGVMIETQSKKTTTTTTATQRPPLVTERTTRTDTPIANKPAVTPRSYPLSPAAGSLLESARAEASKNNLGRAGDLMERALRIEPNNPTLWMQLAQFRKQQGDNAQAVAMAKRAAQSQPDDLGLERQAWSFIAGIYRTTGDRGGLAEAQSHL